MNHLLVMAVCLGVVPDGLQVLTFDPTRSYQCGSIDHTFITGNAYVSVREAMLDMANFGAAGVVSRQVDFTTPVPDLCATDLIGVDVVLVSQLQPTFSSEEVALLNRFVSAGGGLFVFANEGGEKFGPVFGAVPHDDGQGCASISSSQSPAVGPFGNVTGCISPNFHRTLASVGPNGSAFMTSTGIAGATFSIGAGQAVIVCDEDWAMDITQDGCNVGTVTEAKIRLFLNAVAEVAPAAAFEFGEVRAIDFCLTGPDTPFVTTCSCTDLDGDLDTDIADFMQLQLDFTAPMP